MKTIKHHDKRNSLSHLHTRQRIPLASFLLGVRAGLTNKTMLTMKTKNKMKTTYKNDAAFKAMFVAETIKHRKADELIKGTYEQGGNGTFKGCAVGCAIETINNQLGKSHDNSDHSVLEEESLYPEWLAHLQDTIFEGLEESLSQTWPERFSKAIPVGVEFTDLDKVKYQFCIYLLEENIKTVKGLDISDSLRTEVIDSIRQVVKVHENALSTGEWDGSAAESAAWSATGYAGYAGSAARSAARSAVCSTARSAAESAAWSAAESAGYAGSAARSAFWSAAESAAYKRYSNKLLTLLKDSEVSSYLPAEGIITTL